MKKVIWPEGLDMKLTGEIIAMQRMINSGMAWNMEGAYGRAAMGGIEEGVLMLGRYGRTDYWGSRVPSRTQVKAGTKGSFAYVEQRQGRDYAKALAEIGEEPPSAAEMFSPIMGDSDPDWEADPEDSGQPAEEK